MNKLTPTMFVLTCLKCLGSIEKIRLGSSLPLVREVIESLGLVIETARGFRRNLSNELPKNDDLRKEPE
jgi:hypothetical protein